jgi:hypothetical protein
MKLVEGVDYVWDGNRMVLTRDFLLRRGYCCNARCRNCPYRAAHQENSKEIIDEDLEQ